MNEVAESLRKATEDLKICKNEWVGKARVICSSMVLP